MDAKEIRGTLIEQQPYNFNLYHLVYYVKEKDMKNYQVSSAFIFLLSST